MEWSRSSELVWERTGLPHLCVCSPKHKENLLSALILCDRGLALSILINITGFTPGPSCSRRLQHKAWMHRRHWIKELCSPQRHEMCQKEPCYHHVLHKSSKARRTVCWVCAAVRECCEGQAALVSALRSTQLGLSGQFGVPWTSALPAP